MTEPAVPAPQVPDRDQHLRVSDAERDRVVEQLREHAAVGRLTIAEFEQRAEQALTAQTRAELTALLGDLPPAGAPRPRKPKRWFVSAFGTSFRIQRIRVQRKATSIAVMASPDIDLCNADLDSAETTIRAFAFVGYPDIYVPDSAELEVSGFSLIGGYSVRGSRNPPAPGAPVIRIRSHGFLGRHTVWRLPPELQSLTPRQARRAARALHGQAAGQLPGPEPGS